MSGMPAMLLLLASCAGCVATDSDRIPLDVQSTALDKYWLPAPGLEDLARILHPGSCASATVAISSSGQVVDIALDRVAPDDAATRDAATRSFLNRTYIPSRSNGLRRPVRVRVSLVSVLTNEDGSSLDVDLVSKQCDI